MSKEELYKLVQDNMIGRSYKQGYLDAVRKVGRLAVTMPDRESFSIMLRVLEDVAEKELAPPVTLNPDAKVH